MKRVIAIVVCLVLSVPAHAASGDECGIWPCLMTGFAPGCEGPKKAMYKRLFQFKRPAPPYSSCSLPGSPDTYEMRRGTAILMGSYLSGNQIVQPEELIIDGGFCNHRDSGHEEPRGCRATLNTYQAYKNGQPEGGIYYRNKSGQDYIRDPLTGDIRLADVVPSN